MRELTDARVVVTGAGNGIGRGMAEAFGARGAKVMVVDIQPDAIAETVAALEASGATAAGVEADVSDPAQVAEVGGRVREVWGWADVVCANAGVGTREAPAWELSADEWRWIMGINVMGVANVAREFVPDMIARDRGHVVVTASMQGITTGRVAAYAASKHAAASLAESLYGDLRRRGSGVGVSCLCPSYTKNSLVTNPDRYVAPPGSELSDAELELRREVGRKLAEHGIEPRVVGDLVADAVVNEQFWVIPARESLGRVTQRATEIVEGRPPSLATT